ncbi:MAG: tyrosine-type recombinase/integrase [Promethearchaeota archaeon]
MKGKGPNNYRYPEHFKEKVPYYDEFLERYSQQTVAKNKNKLIYFALFLENIYGIKMLHPDGKLLSKACLEFFKEDINKRDIIRESKSKWRNFLNSYYNYVKEIKEKLEGINYINPIPSINLLDFDEKEISIEDLEQQEDVLTYPIAEKVLNYLFFTRKRLFVIVSLLLYSGARISEIMHLEINNIDFEERFFYTKVKSKKSLNRWGLYFFPEFFVPHLKAWIQEIQQQYKEPNYLFQYGQTHLTDKSPRMHLRKIKNILGLNCRMNPHSFRDLINTARFEKGLNTKFRSLLLNQLPRNVNVKHYLKKYKKRKELLRIYDQTFPYPEFEPNLNIKIH